MRAKIGRLAMRMEGESWNAYFAKLDTMDGAIFLGSIRMAIVQNNSQLRDDFFDLMQEAISQCCDDIVGQRPDWNDLQEAPEHEKSGRA